MTWHLDEKVCVWRSCDIWRKIAAGVEGMYGVVDLGDSMGGTVDSMGGTVGLIGGTVGLIGGKVDSMGGKVDRVRG